MCNVHALEERLIRVTAERDALRKAAQHVIAEMRADGTVYQDCIAILAAALAKEPDDA